MAEAPARSADVKARTVGWVKLVAVILLALVGTALVHKGLWGFGGVVAALARGGSSRQWSPHVPACLIGAFGFLGVSFAISRLRAGRKAWVLSVVTALCYIAVAYKIMLPAERWPGEHSRLPRGVTHAWNTDAVTLIDYRNNSLGYRGADWQPKPAGAVRVGLIGDSFVYGIGLREEDTLSAQMAKELSARIPGRSFDVMNLGLPGQNLEDYVDEYDTVAPRLDLDATVVVLHSNDLEDWGPRREERLRSSVSIYSFSSFLLGNELPPYMYAAVRSHFEAGGGSIPDDRATHLLEKLDKLHKRHGEPWAVFSHDQGIINLLKHLQGPMQIPFMAMPERKEEWFYPRDGHPTPLGNQIFASVIVQELLKQTSAWSANPSAASP